MQVITSTDTHPATPAQNSLEKETSALMEMDELLEDEDELDLASEIERALIDPESEQPANDTTEQVRSLELAHAYYQMGLYDDAIQEIRQDLSNSSDSAEALWLLGRCQHRKGEVKEAIHLYQTVLNRTDLSETQELAILFDLGLAYEAHEEYALALELFDEIVSIDEHFRESEISSKIAELSSRISEVKKPPTKTLH
jgi:tetratricopeptide (TPR) repeat protein